MEHTGKIAGRMNHRMTIYCIIMALLVAVEYCTRYSQGIKSILLYSVTPLKFLLCRYMVRCFDIQLRQGLDYGHCKRSFAVLSWLFALDFIGNLVFTVPFPVRHVMASYAFFMGLAVVEFTVSSHCIIRFLPEYGNVGIYSVWVMLNLILGVLTSWAFIYSFTNHFFAKWVMQGLFALLFLREVLALYVVNTPVESGA